MAHLRQSLKAGAIGIVAGGLLSATIVAASAASEARAEDRRTTSPTSTPLSAASAASARLASVEGVKVDRAVLEQLDSGGTADFWVVLEERADLGAASDIDDWAGRGQYVYDRLTATARISQFGLTTRLRTMGVDFESFWIANTVLVHDAQHTALDDVLTQEGVSVVSAAELIELPDPVEEPDEELNAEVAAIEWGVANIRADVVWQEFGVRGEGVVVGSIDTGVQYTHPALVRQYRGNLGEGIFDHNYNWWDPSDICPGDEPCDNNQHGTHTTGTMVGDDSAGNRIGVAPGAQWIAAKGCESRTCSESALLSAGQFMLAPTNLGGGGPRPDLRPHVLNNSWGGDGGRPWFDQMVAAWTAAGMFPVFSNGNSGPGCDTAGSPADGPDAYGVGAYDSSGQIAAFSGRGPGRGEEIRPNISAPGVAVRSSTPGGGYGLGSGTSMAAPHVAGTVALMWSAAGQVGGIEATRAALARSAVDTEDLSCGGTPDNNNVYGQGRLDALEATRELAIDSGISGTVTDADTGQPVAGVRVDLAGHDRSVRTDTAGRYQFRVEPGGYELGFSVFGYLTTTITDISVTATQFTTVDTELDRAPNGGIAGTVTDAVSGHTVPGVRVQVIDVPADLAARTDVDGRFEISGVPTGTYEIRATSRWSSATAEITVTAGDPTVADIGLPAPYGPAERVTVSSDGGEGNAASGAPGWTEVSDDGRYLAFYSEATNLVDEPVVARWNVYVHDRHTSTTELISVSSSSEPADNGAFEGASWTPSMSADGRFVAFSSNAGNLVDKALSWTCDVGPTPLQPCGHIYVRDRLTGTTELVSVNSAGEPATDGSSQSPSISPDGRYVAFRSAATNLTDAALPECGPQPAIGRALCDQIYVHDRVAGTTKLASTNAAGEPGNEGSTFPSVSADGRYVAWQSRATNLTGETTSDSWDVFVHDLVTGETEWVSTLGPELSPPTELLGGISPDISGDGRFIAYSAGFAPWAPVYDRLTGETQLMSASDDPGSGALVLAGVPRMTTDGRLVAFAALELDDSGAPVPEATGLFVADRDSGALDRVIDSYDGTVDLFLGDASDISSDGRYVVVSSEGDKLAPGDTNGVADQYLVDRQFDAGQPRSRFAAWDLSVDPSEPQPAQPVELTVDVKNVGDGPGTFTALPLIDGVAETEAGETVTLAPGEATEATATVGRVAGGNYHARVGPVAGEFRVQSGTLTGSVTDTNDGTPISGATVTATSGETTRTASTLGGAYQLEDLQLGTWTVTIEAEDYVTDVKDVTLTERGQQITLDGALRTGLAAVEPAEFAIELQAGSAESLQISLENAGSADLSWDAFGWNATVGQDPSILIFSDDWRHLGPNTYVEQALRRLDLDYTAFYGGGGSICPTPGSESHAGFQAALAKGGWDLVIVAHECSWAGMPIATLDALQRYVDDGGSLILHTWQLATSNPPSRDHPLWAAMGVQSKRALTAPFGPFPMYWWTPDHALLTDPLRVPAFTAPELSYGFGGFAGVRVQPLAGFDALAGFTESMTPDHAGLVLGNDGRTLFRGFFDSPNDADLNDNAIPDGVELWVNSIIQVGDVTADPWLSVSQSGMLPPGDDTTVTVTVDAGQLSPGTYTGTVGIVTDAGAQDTLAVPVTVTVTPDTTGPEVTVTGLVDGNTYGDATTLNLAWTANDPSGVDATTATLDGTPLQPGALPLYPLPLGTHTLQVTATDHAGNPTTVSVTFTTRTSYQDVATLVDRFRAAGTISLPGSVKLQTKLLAAALLDLLGLDKQAAKQLNDFKKLATDQRNVTDPTTRHILTRDANALIAAL